MALDVWVGYPSRNNPENLIVAFEPEAYYTFLYSLFEDFAARHGKMIDQYAGTEFNGSKQLDKVLELVESAKSLIAAQPARFDVHMGTFLGSAIKPCHEEIYHTVTRAEYLAFVERLRFAVLEAKKKGESLWFVGD